jgi:hypothetical protein
VTYVITDNLGNMVANVPLTLLLIPGATAADLAPIVAFELNLVGPINGETAVLTSGAGTITYASPSGLWVLSEEPDCVETGVGTLENANSSYGIMSFFGTGPATKYTQSFSISNTVPPPGPRQRPR